MRLIDGGKNIMEKPAIPISEFDDILWCGNCYCNRRYTRMRREFKFCPTCGKQVDWLSEPVNLDKIDGAYTMELAIIAYYSEVENRRRNEAAVVRLIDADALINTLINECNNDSKKAFPVWIEKTIDAQPTVRVTQEQPPKKIITTRCVCGAMLVYRGRDVCPNCGRQVEWNADD